MKGVLRMDAHEKLMDQYDDAAFALLMDRSAEEEGAELLRAFREASAADALPEYTDGLDQRCRDSIDREFDKQTRRVRFRRFARSAARAAVLVFAMIGLMGTLILSVEAWRAPFLDALIERHEEYSLYLFEKEEETAPGHTVKVKAFESLIGEDYQLISESITENVTMVVYQNAEGYMAQLYIIPASGEVKIDTEDAIVSDILVDRYEGILLEEDEYQVMWENTAEQQLYTVIADGMSKDTVLEICNILASLD